VRKRAVTLTLGEAARDKSVSIEGREASVVEARLKAALER
jgi:uncharacterized protein YggU (UPF0235/DUF167 family)